MLGIASPSAVLADVALTKGMVSKSLLDQFKIQIIANATIETTRSLIDDDFSANRIFSQTLEKSISGIDGADAIIGFYAKNKAINNVLSGLVDLNYNSEQGEFKFNSLINGKSEVDVIIDVAFNFATDGFQDKIPNTRFSGPFKDAMYAIGVDANQMLKNFIDRRGEYEFDNSSLMKSYLMNSNDATKVEKEYRVIDE